VTVVTDDLASLLASGERAVFHGAPGAAVADLEQAVVRARKEGRYAEVTAAAWLLGVALSASGRYGGALSVLSPLLEAGEKPDSAAETKLFAALAAATAASVHRSLGRHDTACSLDTRGLALTDGSGEAGFDCLLGLAADAVGAEDARGAGQWLQAAEALAGAHGEDWWRQQVRLDWVRCEVALLTGDADAALTAATAAVDRAEAARAPRHVAKGLLFTAVAELASGGDPLPALRRSATLADSLGVLPVLWQARALLGALTADDDVEGAAAALSAARSVVLQIAGDLAPDIREQWLDRPNVAALLGG
jgi:tetratricopeptide (TPR) repeat protein